MRLAQLHDQRRVLAHVARVAVRTLARGESARVQRAPAVILARQRAQRHLAPDARGVLRALARRFPRTGQRARGARPAVTVARALLAELARESRHARARAVHVQHALVLAYVPQHFVRDQIRLRVLRRLRDVLQHTGRHTGVTHRLAEGYCSDTVVGWAHGWVGGSLDVGMGKVANIFYQRRVVPGYRTSKARVHHVSF